MVQVGDIVAVKKWRGLWVVREQHRASLPSKRWIVFRERPAGDDGATEHLAGQGDLTLVERPEITVGDFLKFHNRDSRVLAVSDDTIRLTYDERTEVAGGGFIRFNEQEADVARAALVLENLRAFLR